MDKPQPRLITKAKKQWRHKFKVSEIKTDDIITDFINIKRVKIEYNG